MRFIASGVSGYRGNITDAVYNETDWGTHADDSVRFADVQGREVWLNLRHMGSLNFGSPSAPSVGTHNLYRVVANWERGAACDCLVSDDEKVALVAQMADDMADKIISFTTIYGIEVRLVTANIGKILIVPEDLTIQP